METVKFRAWDGERFWDTSEGYFVIGNGGYWEYYLNGNDDVPMFTKQDNGSVLEQFTGLLDKHVKDIYEGDLILYRYPYRSTQTHTGDNIPNGKYVEPMEPEIRECEAEVRFVNGIFTAFAWDDPQNPGPDMPLSWVYYSFDESTIKECISWQGKDIFDWHNGEDGELDYLLSEYEKADLKELCDWLTGFEIIGSIHQSKQEA